jgi:tetratricopeptide (TPR) repeat protein
VQLNIGHCYLELKQYDEALNYYFKVELLNSNNTRAWRSIAWCAFLSNKFDVAQKYYARILENKPNAHDYLNAGHVELCLDNNSKTVEFYKLSQNAAGSLEAFNSMLEDDIELLNEAGVDTKILPIIVDKMLYDSE